MEEVLNDEAQFQMHSEDDKALLEKNKKRMVKTRAQIKALEKFYSEHKYPTETMKIRLAESIGLTEKQVSGWFCHRRLKDKRLINGDNHVILRQDRSSGVIQDHGSGHRQDSCGSTKLGNDKNFDTREVESGRLNHQEYSAAEIIQNRMDDATSGSSSSLRNMSNHHHKGDHPFDVATSGYLIPKFPMDVKPKSGPSGYLKVKGQAENGAITAVKRQLGKHYREDGPPLSVEFDPLPPGAFESSMHDPVDEACYTGEAVLCTSPDISKFHQYSEFGKGGEYNSSTASHNLNMIRTSCKVPQWSDIPENYIHQKFKENISLSSNGAYNPERNSYIELPEISARDRSGSEGKDEYGMRYRQRIEDMRMTSVSSKCRMQPFGWKLGVEEESCFHKYNDVHRRSAQGETIDNGSSNLSVKGFGYQNSFNKVQPGQITEDGRTCAERRIINENRGMIPCKNDTTAPKRMRDEFPQQPHLKKSSVLDNQRSTYRIVRSNFSEDEGSVDTSSSAE